MNRIKPYKLLALVLFLLPFLTANAQSRLLDSFESTQGWSFIKSDGVEMKISLEAGKDGQSLRVDYDFTKGTGYGGVQKWFPIDLPENFAFSFDLRASSPANNFEIKFIDSSGDNVWWVNNRNYTFPQEWKNMRIRRRHISFAWGPTHDREIKRVDRIEFTVASFVGGKGTFWLDNLRFEPLPPDTDQYPAPKITASSTAKKSKVSNLMDGKPNTFWQSQNTQNQSITMDFGQLREFGGLSIHWQKNMQPSAFDILLSNDASKWEKAYSVTDNASHTSYIPLPETETRYLKLQLHPLAGLGSFGISEVKILSIQNSITPNNLYKHIASQAAKGDYPRYFLQQASYWTVTGVNNDLKEAMINEEGMVEVDKAMFSIEPAIEADGTIYNWNNVKTKQTLDFLLDNQKLPFTPNVEWEADNFRLSIGITAHGEANKSSKLYTAYSLTNTSSKIQEVKLHLLIRPFQVNPYYQFLNLEGGAGKLSNIEEVAKGRSIIADSKLISSSRPFTSFSATSFDAGNIYEMLRNKNLPVSNKAYDKSGRAQGLITYTLSLEPGQTETMFLRIPFHETQGNTELLTHAQAIAAFKEASAFWNEKTNHIQFRLPPSAQNIVDTWRANLFYILVNRDIHGIQPGSRSYERSWIRDGSLTSSALMKSGIVDEIKAFTTWYAAHQYENGKVPCVVDFRGPDPVPEHDSHGQLIYLIREYFNFTGDTTFLKQKNENVLQAVAYIESLIAERSTDHYKFGNDSIRAQYGLVPESISHEGYSEKPMHSYWDNFFIIKGLKDAAEIQKILGNAEAYAYVSRIRDTFSQNLYNSLRLSMKFHGIDYLPGCAELGDFDATSTTVALTPCNELKNLPKPEVFNTFEKYYQFFVNRRDGKLDWTNYTPYENRLIGSFILLDQPERAHELIDFFLNDLRPHGWHHWAEVVWNEYRIPRFIGDMPHTWVGSDFINSIRSMFVYENEYDASLVLAAALYQEWIDHPQGMSIGNLPTYYGPLSFEILKTENTYRFAISGDLKLPANGIKIKNFNSGKMPKAVWINGKKSSEFTSNEISVREVPAEVIIEYQPE